MDNNIFICGKIIFMYHEIHLAEQKENAFYIATQSIVTF